MVFFPEFPVLVSVTAPGRAMVQPPDGFAWPRAARSPTLTERGRARRRPALRSRRLRTRPGGVKSHSRACDRCAPGTSSARGILVADREQLQRPEERHFAPTVQRRPPSPGLPHRRSGRRFAHRRARRSGSGIARRPHRSAASSPRPATTLSRAAHPRGLDRRLSSSAPLRTRSAGRRYRRPRPPRRASRSIPVTASGRPYGLGEGPPAGTRRREEPGALADGLFLVSLRLTEPESVGRPEFRGVRSGVLLVCRSRHPAGQPHSPQNLASARLLPQFVQNFFVS
jgi:hypothetical protein